ncbi:MAG: hypothetical protein AAGJ10_20355 [Bacteroidota bacterium]
MSLLKRLARAGNAVAGAAADKVRTTAEHLIDEASGLAEDAFDKVRGVEPDPAADAMPADQTKATPPPKAERKAAPMATPQHLVKAEKARYDTDEPLPEKTVGRPRPKSDA